MIKLATTGNIKINDFSGFWFFFSIVLSKSKPRNLLLKTEKTI